MKPSDSMNVKQGRRKEPNQQDDQSLQNKIQLARLLFFRLTVCQIIHFLKGDCYQLNSWATHTSTREYFPTQNNNNPVFGSLACTSRSSLMWRWINCRADYCWQPEKQINRLIREIKLKGGGSNTEREEQTRVEKRNSNQERSRAIFS